MQDRHLLVTALEQSGQQSWSSLNDHLPNAIDWILRNKNGQLDLGSQQQQQAFGPSSNLRKAPSPLLDEIAPQGKSGGKVTSTSSPSVGDSYSSSSRVNKVRATAESCSTSCPSSPTSWQLRRQEDGRLPKRVRLLQQQQQHLPGGGAVAAAAAAAMPPAVAFDKGEATAMTQPPNSPDRSGGDGRQQPKVVDLTENSDPLGDAESDMQKAIKLSLQVRQDVKIGSNEHMY